MSSSKATASVSSRAFARGCQQVSRRGVPSTHRLQVSSSSSVMPSTSPITTFYGAVSTRQKSKDTFLKEFEKNGGLRNSMTYSLSFATDRNAFELFEKLDMLSDQMKSQLEIAQDQLLRQDMDRDNHEHLLDMSPLPKSMEQILMHEASSSSSNRQRAVVVTDATVPFNIVHVNKAWEGLCGFTLEESQGKTLGELLQGQDTDKATLTTMISKLLQGEHEVGCVVTNYTKEGRRFRNHLRVGPMCSNRGIDHASSSPATFPTHFVGVLQEIHDDM